MFTRSIEVTAKSGKARELTNIINEKVLPILKKQVTCANLDDLFGILHTQKIFIRAARPRFGSSSWSSRVPKCWSRFVRSPCA